MFDAHPEPAPPLSIGTQFTRDLFAIHSKKLD